MFCCYCCCYCCYFIVVYQITHKNRQRRLANIAGLKEPEPYLEPQISQAAAVLVVRNEELEEVATRAIMPSPDSPYAPLGGVEPVNLISFAYQIASGMVSSCCIA